MDITQKFLASLAIFLLSSISFEVSAQEVYGLHPSACEAQNPVLSHKLRNQEYGVENVNKVGTAAIWVVCPIPLEFFDSNSQDSVVAAVLGNASGSGKNVTCILRYVTGSGNYAKQAKKRFIPSNGVQEYQWEIVNKNIIGPNIACKLPPRTALAGLIYGTSEY